MHTSVDMMFPTYSFQQQLQLKKWTPQASCMNAGQFTRSHFEVF